MDDETQPKRAKRAGAALKKIAAAYLKSLEAGKAAYSQADELLEKLLGAGAVAGTAIELPDGRTATLVDQENLLGVIFGLIDLAVMPFSIILRGWVLTRLWLWYVVPQFSVAPLGVAESIGLALTLRMLTSRAQTCKKDDRPFWEKAVEDMAASIVTPLVALLFGYIVYSFVS